MSQNVQIADLDNLSEFIGFPLVLLDSSGVIVASSRNIPTWLDYHDLGEPLAGRMLLFFDENGGPLSSAEHPLNQVLENAINIREAAFCLSRDDTGPVMALVSMTAVAIGTKGMKGVLLAIHPGTADQHEDDGEPSLQELQKKIRDLEQNHERMLSMIHHDLKSPLIGLKGLSEILIRNPEKMPAKELLRLLTLMNRTAEHNYVMFDKLFAWALTQTNSIKCQKKPLDLAKLLQDNVLVLANQAEQKNIKVDITCPEGIWIFADETMMGSVLQNLLSNSIKFTARDGRVGMTADAGQGEVTIKIRDTGVGMSAETINKLFKAYQKSSRTGTEGEKGAGLGLLLCQDFVERHGGQLLVKSEPDQGTEFTFSLPLFGEERLPKQSA